MALPPVGSTISLSQIQTEFGGSNPISLSEYYSKGNAPASGAIDMSADFGGTSNTRNIDYLVVAGGGGGGTDDGGGGGAGGFRTATNLSISGAFTVTVGAGGSASTNGVNSILSSITSLPGGGGFKASAPGGSVGSGGGGGYLNGTGKAGTAGQGNAGGNANGASGGGGGGASSAGTTGSGANNPGDGGDGIASSYSGSSVVYAGGGGGGGRGTYSSSGGSGGGGRGARAGGQSNQAGTANKGGGGGGGQGAVFPASFYGKNGGSGIVIVRYSDSLDDISSIGAGLTYNFSTSGGYKIYKFTAGTGSVEF